MNTLLLAPELFTTDSGISRTLRLYLKALCDLSGAKDRVRFVSLNDANIDSADLRPCSGGALSEWTACNRDKKQFFRDVLKLSRGTRLIICGHIGQLPVAWLASLARPGLRYMLVAHGGEVRRPFTFWERRALKGAHRILCISEFTKRELLKQLRIDERRLVVLPNALDPSLEPGADASSISTTQPVILAVSRLSSADRYKGIDHLIAAMPSILSAAPGTKLRVIGRGDDAHRLQDLAREHRLGSAVEFAGYVGNDQLRHEFARCTLFALPSQNEGFPLAYLEAMAAGKPCIAADSGGSPEIITEKSGLLVPYGDVPALSAACLRALGNNWNTAEIQACAQQFSYARFKERMFPILSS